MSGTDDWNANIIAEFRANEGRVGGPFGCAGGAGSPPGPKDRARSGEPDDVSAR